MLTKSITEWCHASLLPYLDLVLQVEPQLLLEVPLRNMIVRSCLRYFEGELKERRWTVQMRFVCV